MPAKPAAHAPKVMTAATPEERREKGFVRLREPFDEHQIGKLPKPYKSTNAKGNCRECGGYHGMPAAHLDYVGHAALTDRLLEVDPEWHWEPLAFDQHGLPLYDNNNGMWIKLTVLGVTRIGYGDAQGKGGPNGVKELIGDALRNAGMRFGMALDLWHKGDLHANDEEAGLLPGQAEHEQEQDAQRRSQPRYAPPVGNTQQQPAEQPQPAQQPSEGGPTPDEVEAERQALNTELMAQNEEVKGTIRAMWQEQNIPKMDSLNWDGLMRVRDVLAQAVEQYNAQSRDPMYAN